MSEPTDQTPNANGSGRGPSLGFILAVVGLLFFGLWILLPAVRSGPSPRREQCLNNLHQIGVAMQNYEAKYGNFPPAYVADRDGRPLYSWRVLLLPFLDRNDLYESIRLDEPWDSPHNRSLLKDSFTPSFYHCASATNPKSETSYVMVIGPNTMSDGPHSVKLGDITDGVANTLMVVEIKNSGIHWAEPRDLDFVSMSFRINDPKGRGISSDHSGMVTVLYADGHMESLPDDLDPKIVKALLTVNGGEDVSDFTGTPDPGHK